MYICDKCGLLTDELTEYVVYYPYGSTVAGERCIHDDCACGGTFVAAEQCEECGEYYSPYDENNKAEDCGCCPDCQGEARKALSEFMNNYSKPMQWCIAELASNADY